MTQLSDAITLYNAKRFEEAYPLFYDLAAYHRSAEAMYYLGMMYRDGEGVEKSLDNALAWWKKATRGGHQGAAFAMSEFKASTKTMF